MKKNIDWDMVKADYDNGLSDDALAKKYKVAKTTMQSHRLRNGWGQANQNPKSATGKLTADEVYFCELYARSIPQYRAYQIAYNQKDMANSRASDRAYKLLQRPVIRTKIDEIVKHTAKARKWQYADYVDEVVKTFFLIKSSLYDEGIKKGNTDAYFNALDRIKDVFQFDRMEKIKRDQIKAQIQLTKAKLKSIDGSDDDAMQQVNKLLDELNKDL